MGANLQAVLKEASSQSPDSKPDAAPTIMESRFALLNLLSTILQANRRLQSQAVRTWDAVTALFCLFPDPAMRSTALKMVKSEAP